MFFNNKSRLYIKGIRNVIIYTVKVLQYGKMNKCTQLQFEKSSKCPKPKLKKIFKMKEMALNAKKCDTALNLKSYI